MSAVATLGVVVLVAGFDAQIFVTGVEIDLVVGAWLFFLGDRQIFGFKVRVGLRLLRRNSDFERQRLL